MANFLNRQGQRLHYREEGHGAPVLLVHGVGSRLSAWDGVLARLPAARRYIRLDLRGHGDSARVSGPYSLSVMAEDIIDLADHLGLEEFALVGFSLGGLIAQQIALDHPERLSCLALISTVAGRTEGERHRVLKRRDVLRQEGPLKHLGDSAERWFTDEFIANNPEILEKRRAEAMQNDPECYMAAYDVLAESDLGESVHAITTPTLVMTGEHDIGSNPRMAQLLHERIAGSELRILGGLKHSILLEAPETVARQLGSFLDRTLAKPHTRSSAT